MTLASMPCRYTSFILEGAHLSLNHTVVSVSLSWFHVLVENFGPRWPTEDGPEVLKKCHGQAVCCMPNTYASGKQSTLKPRKQEDLRENRGWWKSGTLVSLHTHFCCPEGMASNWAQAGVAQASQVQPQESSEQEAEIGAFPGAGMALQVILSPWRHPSMALLSLHSVVSPI